jgi:hypothetical protein
MESATRRRRIVCLVFVSGSVGHSCRTGKLQEADKRALSESQTKVRRTLFACSVAPSAATAYCQSCERTFCKGIGNWEYGAGEVSWFG